ncbi:UbiA family prenyltransferase [Aestuariibius insulae]|uniref:UbiA family prenyltransferase n=1 Tax=Aestuariibius insulae TaxID=2058287 RepID=UPI00345E3901
MNTVVSPPKSETQDADQAQLPLVVDLDGTLTSSDTLHEALLKLASDKPSDLRKTPGWLREGKAAFKSHVADSVVLTSEDLPLRDEVIALAKKARAEGRTVLLVTAADQRQADGIAGDLDLFDEIVGSDGTRNLGGSEKAAYLTDRFGAGGFDYVGDARADLPVWSAARKAITVAASPSLKPSIRSHGGEVETLVPAPDPAKQARIRLKAMRPHQWLKNLLIFVPAIAAHNPGALGITALAFIAFSLAASSIYLINDMLDLQVDRRHPRKRNRPFAAGTLSVKDGAIQTAILLAVSLTMAVLISPLFLLVLLGYVALTTLYSFYLKRKLMVDIWMLAALYTVRLVAGAVAAGVVLSEWLAAFSMFIFLALAAVKRQSELADLVKRGKTSTDGRGYQTTDLPVVLGVVLAAGYCSVLVLALYVSSESVSSLYGEPRLLWLACPLILYWISRAAMISHRGLMDDDPIIFAIKDRVSLAIFAMFGFIFVLSALL